MQNRKKYQLNPVQQKLVNDHLNYAMAYINRYKNRNADMDDLIQEAVLGLCDAAILYKNYFGATFETFATPHIHEKCSRFIKRYSRTQILSLGDDDDVETQPDTFPSDKDDVDTQVITTTSLSKYDEDEGNLSFEETLPDPDSMKSEKQLNYKLLVERLLSILNDRERKMVKCAYYIDHQSQIRLRVWQRFNLSKPRFYYIVNQSILKMAEYAQNNNIESPFKN